MATCNECGREFSTKSVPHFHARTHQGGNVAVAEKPKEAVAGQIRSERGKRRYTEALLTPLDQIRMQPANNTGAWCYYLRPDGATIRDALIAYPNGGIPQMEDPKLQAKYATNASYYHNRNRAKGFTPLGQVLDERAMRLLVETLARNREDEILFLEDEIATCEFNRINNDIQREREIAARRKAQYQRRLEMMLQPFDPDALLQELNDISRAQRLSKLPAGVMAVMREMIGEVNSKISDMAAQFARGRPRDQDPSLTGITITSQQGTGSEFGEGKQFIDSD